MWRMDDLSNFQHPGNEFRIHPFWFWNGDMEEGEIRLQLREMADKGVGGVFICARQGMTLPYLSREWFARVRFAVQEAKQLGMDVWLYDEYPYPSGMAGGEVLLEHPEAKHRTLAQTSRRVRGGETVTLDLPWGRVLYAKAAPLAPGGKVHWDEALDLRAEIGNYQAEPIFQKAGLTAYNQKRFFTYRTVQRLRWTAPAGEWEIFAVVEEEIGDFKYYGTYVDPCHKEAMRTFIRLTHEQYKKHLGDYFGNPIKGMFTDETGLLGEIPWSPQLPGFFRAKYGYDLREHLPALWRRDVPDAARIRYEYYQAIHLLLRESYHEQIREWCDRAGLQYVAEVPSVRMTTQKFSTVPGGDSAHEKLGRPLEWILNRYAVNMRGNPKMVSSLARQLGSRRNLIECFHSVGWSMNLQDARWMIDRMAAQGTNFYNFHAFFYTLDGLAKHDAPPSQFLQNPYWGYFRALGDYTGRISQWMSQGVADISIAIVDPTTTLWTFMANPLHGFQYGGGDEAEKARLQALTRDWAAIGKELQLSGRDYDHLDPELLSEARIEDGALVIGDARYTVLILPPATNIEGAAWAQIRRFLEAGGHVIGLGLLPYEKIDAQSPDEQEVLEWFGVEASPRRLYWDYQSEEAAPDEPRRTGNRSAHFLPYAAQDGPQGALAQMLKLLDRLSPASVSWSAESGRRAFLIQVRRLEGQSAAVFLSNQEGQAEQGTLRVDAARLGLGGAGSLRASEWSLETGAVTPLPVRKTGGGWEIPLRLAPWEARAVRLDASASDVDASSAREAEPQLLTLDAAGPWELAADRPNALRLDTFRLFAGGMIGRNPQEEGFPVPVKTFIDQCSDLAGSASFGLRFRQTFGTPMKLAMAYPVPCEYRTEFEVSQQPRECRLLMDRSAISGRWTIEVNGRALESGDFSPYRLYDNTNIACEIAPYLRTGRNTLSVKVEVERDWDGVVDALYLIGPFGVFYREGALPELAELPREASAVHGGPYAGFPHYAGALTFRRIVTIAEVPQSPQFRLDFGSWDPQFHECAELRVNGRPVGVRPWSPYVWQGPSDVWKPGENEIEVRITTSLAGLLEGRYFDYGSHRLLPVQEAREALSRQDSEVR